MDLTTIKTGDIFYYDSYSEHNSNTHHHKCRVLFVGSESIFYDSCWDGIDKWTFVPVRKLLGYYRFRLTILPKLKNLRFKGFEEIDQNSVDKLYLKSPEILLSTTKEMIVIEQSDQTLIDAHADSIAFIPLGPKGGTLKPVILDSKHLTKGRFVTIILAYQNLEFIRTDKIVLHRIGLHSGVPSYCIQTN